MYPLRSRHGVYSRVRRDPVGPDVLLSAADQARTAAAAPQENQREE